MAASAGKIAETVIRSDSVAGDAGFWVDTFGMDVLARTTGWVRLQDPRTGQRLTLVNFGPIQTPWAMVSIESDDIDSALRQLAEAGGDVEIDRRTDPGMAWALVSVGDYPLFVWQPRSSPASS